MARVVVMGRDVFARGEGVPITTARALAAVVSAVLAFSSPQPLPAQSVTLNGASPSLIIDHASPGSAPTPASDNSTRVSITTLVPSNLVAALDAPLPSGVTLRASVQAPVGAVSLGFVTLDDTPRVLVSDIPPGTYPALVVTYELIATPAAGTASTSSRQVAFALQTGT